MICLGAQVDSEDDGRPSMLADGDDNHNNSDEDGVTFPSPLIPGQSVPVEVTAFNPGNLSVWIDFDINGAWDISEGMSFHLDDGKNIITINVPECAMQESYTYARFRFSSTPSLPPYGYAPDGEVEDYRVYIGASSKCISGYKLNSSDGSGLSDWTIEVYDSAGQSVGNDTTNETGYWQICGLAPGVYNLDEITQDGWMTISRPSPVSLDCRNITN